MLQAHGRVQWLYYGAPPSHLGCRVASTATASNTKETATSKAATRISIANAPVNFRFVA